MTIIRTCIYCVKEFSFTTKLAAVGHLGVCPKCQSEIDKAESPTSRRLQMEWEAVRSEMNNGRRI